jgi:hypothetical protein
MTKHELLRSKVDNAGVEWLIRPHGFGRVIRYFHYVYLRHKLYSMPLYEAEKTLKVIP